MAISLGAACQANIFLVVSSLASNAVDRDTNLLVPPELGTLVAQQASCTTDLSVNQTLITAVAGDSSNNYAYSNSSRKVTITLRPYQAGGLVKAALLAALGSKPVTTASDKSVSD